MRAIALCALLSLGGCSFLTARPTNKPREGCSRTVGRMDGALALLGVVGIAAVAVNRKVDPPHDHNNSDYIQTLGLLVSAGLLLVEGAQALYGFHVADECEAERARLTTTSSSRPAGSPATSAP